LDGTTTSCDDFPQAHTAMPWPLSVAVETANDALETRLCLAVTRIDMAAA
jgi:hypothetical protein